MSEGLKNLLTAFGSVVVLVGVAEGVTRLATRGEPNATRTGEEGYVASPEVGWRRKPGFAGFLEGGERDFDSRGLFQIDSADVETESVKRVIFLGGSNTFGYRVPNESTFVELTEARIDGAVTINLGMPAYTTFQANLLLKEFASRYPPAVVVAEFGMHDRARALDGKPDSPGLFSARYGGWSARALASLNLEVIRRLRTAISSRNSKTRCHSVDSLIPRLDLVQFRQNLTALAKTAEDARAPIIFVYLGTAPEEVARYQRADSLARAGNVDAAIEDLKLLVGSGKDGSWSYRLLARQMMVRILREAGRPEAASAWSCVSIDVTGPVRHDSSYVRVMREVARESGSEMLQLPWLPDSSFFGTDSHITQRGHHRVADLLAPYIARALSLPVREPQLRLDDSKSANSRQ